MAEFTLNSFIAAPPEVVFDVLADHRGYAHITQLRAAKLEREGDPAPNGVGAIRALYTLGPPIREQVTEYERPSRLVYKMLSGAPVRDHVGTVELSPEAAGTRMVWHVQTFPRVPAPFSPPLVAVVRLVIGQLATGIQKRAELIAH